MDVAATREGTGQPAEGSDTELVAETSARTFNIVGGIGDLKLLGTQQPEAWIEATCGSFHCSLPSD